MSKLLASLAIAMTTGALALGAEPARVNRPTETALESAKDYANPFVDVEVNVAVTEPEGRTLRVPAFWDGGRVWRFRYATNRPGRHTWRSDSSDAADRGLHGVSGAIEVLPAPSDNPLERHGPIRVAANRRHFEHADGRPFLWLGDTWWKCLCRRMTWEGFQRLAADRKAKGFSVVQIVCGPYPDEGLFEDRWENEGGKPYENRDLSVVNPKYFRYADRRIACLVDSALVPAIVGGWGRGDCDALQLGGVPAMKRHWRHLVARFGAYPTVWIVGGESGGPAWTEIARHVRAIDPYRRPITVHPFQSGRLAVTDESAVDFDMLQTGHGDWEAAQGAIPQVQAACKRLPRMPVVLGEYCYEGHMQTAFQDVQRHVFWGNLLSGSAGHTYGAAGVWHAGVEVDPGLVAGRVYDFTAWEEGMRQPGSKQLGLGRRLLEQLPWHRFEPRPEWAEGGFAAGIPNEARVVYLPRRKVYDWSGPVVKGLEPQVPYRWFYFDPTNGRRYDQGTVVNLGPPPPAFEGHSSPPLFEDPFEGPDGSAWTDYGTPTQRRDGKLIGGKGMATVVERLVAADAMGSVAAASDAEAGVLLRFHGPDDYLVGLYTPSLKKLYVQRRKGGQWGPPLGAVPVAEIGPQIRLAAAVCGPLAAAVVSDGTRTYRTPLVEVDDSTPGKAGLWLYQIGQRQEYRDFKLSRVAFRPEALRFREDLERRSRETDGLRTCSGDFQAPNVPSPQDWVLVFERARP